MTHPIVLHIGPLKTGTTYLQAGLQQRREQLAENGWLYPEVDAGLNQERAFFGLLGEDFVWVSAAEKLKWAESAEDFVDQIAVWDGPLIISAEALSVLKADAAQAVTDLFPGRPIRVVVTARDLGRVIPSHLTQLYKTGRGESAGSLLKRVSSERDAEDSWFWRMYDYADLVERWAALDAVVDIKLVTVPASAGQAELLWDRFLEAAGMDLPVRLAPPIVGPDERNLSLTAPEARLVRSVNLAMQEQGRSQDFVRGLLAPVLHTGLARREAGTRGPSLEIPAAWADDVRSWAAADVERLTAVKVVGDLADLEPRIRPSVEGDDDATQLRPGERDVVAAAVAAMIAMYDESKDLVPVPGPSVPLPKLTFTQRLRRKAVYLANGRKLPDPKPAERAAKVWRTNPKSTNPRS